MIDIEGVFRTKGISQVQKAWQKVYCRKYSANKIKYSMLQFHFHAKNAVSKYVFLKSLEQVYILCNVEICFSAPKNTILC